MSYRISDVADIFQISREMVRYYEKQGVISSVRKTDNNYRMYSIWDVFSFLDFLQYKEMGLSAKELADIRKHDFSTNMCQRLKQEKQRLEDEIRYKECMRARIEEILERMECYRYNEENYWVKRVGGRYLFHFLTSENDEYGDVDMPVKLRKEIFSDRLMPMLDPCVEFRNKNEWWYAISEKYDMLLDEDCKKQAEYQPPKICLCTVIDMGQIGAFTRECLKPVLSVMQTKGYEQDGDITGVLLGRGMEKQQYIRKMEIQIPIK